MAIGQKILGFLTGGFAEKGVELISKVVKDKDQAERLAVEFRSLCVTQEHELARLAAETEQEIIKGQTEVNKIEAASSSLFKSGWRPAVGWVCVSGLFYQLVVRPLVSWISTIYAWMPPPSLEMDTLLTLLFGILGLGAYRSYERVRGVIPKGS